MCSRLDYARLKPLCVSGERSMAQDVPGCSPADGWIATSPDVTGLRNDLDPREIRILEQASQFHANQGVGAKV